MPDGLIQPQVIMKKIYFLAILAAAGATEVQAQQGQAPQGGNQTNMGSEDNAAIQLSLTPDIALYPRTTTIDGFSLNIWGENEQHGVAFGLVNGSVGQSGGGRLGGGEFDGGYTGGPMGRVSV